MYNEIEEHVIFIYIIAKQCYWVIKNMFLILHRLKNVNWPVFKNKIKQRNKIFKKKIGFSKHSYSCHL